MAQQGDNRVTLASLDPQQLAQLKKKTEADIQQFADSLGFLNKSASIISNAGRAIKELSEAQEGQKLMLPLTQSLYVNGTVASTSEVVIDIGTGYFVEMSTDQGQDYCSRRIEKLKKNSDEVTRMLKAKQQQLLAVETELQNKMAGQGRPQAA